MDRELIHISFQGVDATQAAEYAQELTEYLREAAPEVEVHRVRDDPRAQDLGTSLVLIFASAAASTLVSYLRHKFATELVKEKKGLVESQTELVKARKELVEAQLDYEKLKREPLKKFALGDGGEVVVGYASSQMVTGIEQVVNKARK